MSKRNRSISRTASEKALALFLCLSLAVTLIPIAAFGESGLPATEVPAEAPGTTPDGEMPGLAAQEATEEEATEEPAPLGSFVVTFALPEGMTFADGSSTWAVTIQEGQAVPQVQIPDLSLLSSAERPFLGWLIGESTAPVLGDYISAMPVLENTTYTALFEEPEPEPAPAEGTNVTPLDVYDWKTQSASARIAAATGSGNFILVSPDGTSTKHSSIDAAIDSLNSANRAGQTWLLYVGAAATPSQAKTKAITAQTLVITGNTGDAQPATPTPATSAGSAPILGGGGQADFSCNVLLRNIRYNYSAIYVYGRTPWSSVLGHAR